MIIILFYRAESKIININNVFRYMLNRCYLKYFQIIVTLQECTCKHSISLTGYNLHQPFWLCGKQTGKCILILHTKEKSHSSLLYPTVQSKEGKKSLLFPSWFKYLLVDCTLHFRNNTFFVYVLCVGLE